MGITRKVTEPPKRRNEGRNEGTIFPLDTERESGFPFHAHREETNRLSRRESCAGR